MQIDIDSSVHRDALVALLKQAGISQHVAVKGNSSGIVLSLERDAAARWTPGADTLGLSMAQRQMAGVVADALEQEILVALLAAPGWIRFPSVKEFASHLHMRRNIARAAARTQIAFGTDEASRPEEDWAYAEGSGYTLLPGRSLITALTKATQPDPQGRLFAYSCYRATEYVILLGIAQEMERVNPALLRQLELRWQSSPIASREFHETFLHEFGSMDAPLPPCYFVPGDRVWFSNPDERSSDIAGYEGSWVIYLGGGRFSDFWRAGHAYTLTEKCVEIYHWRDGVRVGPHGEDVMDESRVSACVTSSLADETRTREIMARMFRLRSRPDGTRAEGGCLDASREFPKFVWPETQSIILPELTAD